MCQLLGQLLIVFRGTQTTKEWQENATGVMSQLEGEPEVSGLGLLFNREVGLTMIFSLDYNFLFTCSDAPRYCRSSATVPALVVLICRESLV